MKFLWKSCFENAYTKLTTLHKRFNRTYVFFDYMSTNLLDEYFIKHVCKFHFITNLENTQHLKITKGLGPPWGLKQASWSLKPPFILWEPLLSNFYAIHSLWKWMKVCEANMDWWRKIFHVNHIYVQQKTRLTKFTSILICSLEKCIRSCCLRVQSDHGGERSQFRRVLKP